MSDLDETLWTYAGAMFLAVAIVWPPSFAGGFVSAFGALFAVFAPGAVHPGVLDSICRFLLIFAAFCLFGMSLFGPSGSTSTADDHDREYGPGDAWERENL